MLWLGSILKNCRFIEKLTNINLAENITDRNSIYGTLQEINRYFEFWPTQASSVHPTGQVA